MSCSIESLVTTRRRGRSAPALQLPKRRAVRQSISSEKRAEAFSELGWRLTAALSHGEAAQILMDTADELFGWDACTFDLYSAENSSLTTVLYIDTIEGRRRDVSAQCQGTRPSANTLK